MSNYVLVHGEPINTNELRHYGVLGMKWGVRKGSAYLKRNEYARKRRFLETEEALKDKIASNQREAVSRVKFYGGKNVATNAIKEETRYRQKKNAAQTMSKDTIALGAGFIASGIASSALPMAGGLAYAAGRTFVGAYRHVQLGQRGKEQIAYTKDAKVK